MELWLWEKRQLYLLERGAHTLCKHPLVARGSFRLSICRGSGGGGKRRNDGRKDSGNYCKEQRVTMKNDMEGGVILVAGAASRTAGGTGVGGTRVASIQSTWT